MRVDCHVEVFISTCSNIFDFLAVHFVVRPVLPQQGVAYLCEDLLLYFDLVVALDGLLGFLDES